MSDDNNPGCLQTGCAIWFLLCIVGVIVFFMSNNSINEVEECTFSDISYLLFMPASGGDAEYNERHKKSTKALKKEENIKVNDDLEDALDDNDFISDVKFEIHEQLSGADKVRVSVVLNNENLQIPAYMDFLVAPKSLFNVKLTKFMGLIDTAIILDGKTENLKSINFLRLIYDENALDYFLKEISGKKEKKEQPEPVTEKPVSKENIDYGDWLNSFNEELQKLGRDELKISFFSMIEEGIEGTIGFVYPDSDDKNSKIFLIGSSVNTIRFSTCRFADYLVDNQEGNAVVLENSPDLTVKTIDKLLVIGGYDSDLCGLGGYITGSYQHVRIYNYRF